MPDVFTETTSTSWFSRMKNALMGMLLGLILIPGSMVLMFWNESRAIRETYRLNEGEANVVRDVPVDSVNPDLESQLVHVTGTVRALSPVADARFGIQMNAVQLKRIVEMYQWKEHEEEASRKKLGGRRDTETTYRYEKTWHEDRIDSSDFRLANEYQNPTLPFGSRTQLTEMAELGVFEFPHRLIGSVQNWKDLAPTDSTRTNLPAEIQQHSVVKDAWLYYNPMTTPDPTTPQVGDLRIKFQYVPDSMVTLVSAQKGHGFQKFPTRYGELELLQMGKLSADEVFQRAHDTNSMWTWGLRLAGFVIMGLGFCMIMKPLATLSSVIPFLESLAGIGITILGFGLSVVLSSITIAIAWIAVRPILGLSLFLVAGVVTIGLYYLRPRKPSSTETEHGVELV